MNMEEYRKRIESSHTVTGVPSYWEELQVVTAERDKLKALCEELHARGMLQAKATEKCAEVVDELTKEVERIQLESDVWKDSSAFYKSQAHVQRALHEKSAELVDELNEEIERWMEHVVHLIEIENCNQTNCPKCEDAFSAYEQVVHGE